MKHLFKAGFWFHQWEVSQGLGYPTKYLDSLEQLMYIALFKWQDESLRSKP